MIFKKIAHEAKRIFKSPGARQAIAIMGVGESKLSDFGYEVMMRIEDGSITHEQAKEEIISRARANATIKKI